MADAVIQTSTMPRNNSSPDFVGLADMKRRHADQILLFEQWAMYGYEDFHRNHYDWWTYPIDEPSSFGCVILPLHLRL